MSLLAHAMTGSLVAADFPRLTPAALAPVLDRYPAPGAIRHVQWHSQRPFAASAIVQCATGTVFVKRHDSRVRSVADLLEEHAFIAHLRRRGATVPRVLQADNGATAIAAADGTYEVHAPGDGEDPYRDAPSWTPVRSQAEAAAMGEALAHLHRAAEGFAAPPRRTRLLVGSDALLRSPDPASALAAWLADDPALRAALDRRPWRTDARRVLLPWYEQAARHARTLPPLWGHADFHASNLLWRNGHVSAVLDFGLCNRVSAVWDLATAIERNTIAWLQLSRTDDAIGRPELARALLQGYARVLPLTDTLRAALVHVLPVVHVEFALSELAYFQAVTRSAANADAAYMDFLLGHAAWFAGAQGRHFLDRIACC